MDKADQPALTPANANPWYVLMTLYGNPYGSNHQFDWALQKKNAAAWNAWIGLALTSRQREVLQDLDPELKIPLRLSATRRSEIETAFKNRCLDTMGTRVPPPQLPNPKEEVDISLLEFQEGLATSGMVFPAGLLSNGSRFYGGFQFSGIAFATCSFEDCEFHDSASFSEIVILSDLRLSESIFHKPAWISDVEILREMNLYKCEFKDRVEFSGLTVDGRALIHNGSFEGTAEFSHVDFNDVSFANSRFAEPTYFHLVTFRTQYPDLSGVNFKSTVSFSCEAERWPKLPQTNSAQAKASCSVIRHHLGKQGLPEAEHFFYRREMAFGKEIGGFWERLPFYLYDWLSGYGYSIGRPAMGLVWLWLVPGFAFFMRGATGVPLADVATLFRSLGLSFANMFSFLGLQKTFFEGGLKGMCGAFQTLAGFQTVMGFVLLFYLGLGLRNRFRLK